MASDSSKTCRDILAKLAPLKAQVDAAAAQLAGIEGQIASARTVQELEAIRTRKFEFEAQANRVSGPISSLAIDASLAECRQARDEAEKASNFGRRISFRYASLDDKITDKIVQITQDDDGTTKATTSENNAGTGSPGTAGQGAGADDLQEVTVTGKKTPETVSNDPGATGGDGLEEVTVTGKRNPDELEEVQVTGVRNPDELEEVSVTGKRATDPSAGAGNTNSGVSKARPQAVLKDTTNFDAKKDWRVRLSLSPGATYLYKDPDNTLLAPLAVTDGVLFPYTPNISVSYAANYDATSLVHSNYKIYNYQNSSVDTINITCDFTAQDTYEANYLLSVIHFFRTITKMFYGQDENPKPGTPPPLCYLFGLGEFQFNAHPLAVTNFTYSLPDNVDYIRAGQIVAGPGVNRDSPGIQSPKKPSSVLLDAVKGALSNSRLGQGVAKLGKVIGVDLVPGGNLSGPTFANKGFNSIVPPGTSNPTYVPTNIQISITCIPIVSRYDISNEFSVKQYANGSLLKGITRKGGGMW